MVHYEPDSRQAAQTPPPTCPTCGSHRTEVVDRSKDGRTVTVRCGICGARSAVLIDRRAADADQVTDEIEAIRTVGRALAQLPDADARARVLRWAVERFQIDTTLVGASVATASRATIARQAAPQDPTLSMEGLHELFPVDTAADDDQLGDDEPMMATAETMTVTAEAMTLSAQPVTASADSELLDEATLFMEAEPVVETPRAEETPRLESMVRSLVSDFQRLALDLDTLFAAPAAGSR